ncbi:MAG: hypothetical protein JO165_13995 [Candidatus Eremiobacteraeota bacterium]|nr:hypothetical protein [Candidatus Eremiobacteraeota bacterium]
MREITVEELAEWRKSGKHFVLLDVREPDEVETASVDGALHIPMGDVPARCAEIDRDTHVAVMCHKGGRSSRIARFLQSQGYENVVNVNGGIDAYAERVDETVPRY